MKRNIHTHVHIHILNKLNNALIMGLLILYLVQSILVKLYIKVLR